ncbi:MAG: hypothetical protein HY594_00755 [Candidatus Omnitrophica bacterium]|nr:hypothetical protein [Candidatus Omnitrophota bacterium]
MTSRPTHRIFVRLLAARIIISLITPSELWASGTLRVPQSPVIRGQMEAGLEESDDEREIYLLEHASANPQNQIHWREGNQWHTDNVAIAEALAGGPQRGGSILAGEILPVVRMAKNEIYLVHDGEIRAAAWQGPMGTLFLGREALARLGATGEGRAQLRRAIESGDLSGIAWAGPVRQRPPVSEAGPLPAQSAGAVPTPNVEADAVPQAAASSTPAGSVAEPPPAGPVQSPEEFMKTALAEQVRRALKGYIGPNQVVHAFLRADRDRVRVTSDSRDIAPDSISMIAFPFPGTGQPDLAVVLPSLPPRWVVPNIIMNAGGLQAAKRHPLIREISNLLEMENGSGLDYDKALLDVLERLLNDVDAQGRNFATRLAGDKVQNYLEVVRQADVNQERSFEMRREIVGALHEAAQNGEVSAAAVRAILQPHRSQLAQWPVCQWMLDRWLESTAGVDQNISVEAVVWIVDQIHIAIHEIETQRMLQGAPMDVTPRHYYDALRNARLGRLRELRAFCDQELTPQQIEQLDAQAVSLTGNVVQVEFEEATADALADAAQEIESGQRHASNVQLGAAGVLFLNADGSPRRFVEGGGSYAMPLSFTARFSSLLQQWYQPGDRIVFVYTSVSGHPNVEQIHSFFEDAAACAMRIEGHPEIYLGAATQNGALRVYRPVDLMKLAQRWSFKAEWEKQYQGFRDAVEQYLRTARPPNDPGKVAPWITQFGNQFPGRAVSMFQTQLKNLPEDAVEASQDWVGTMRVRANREVAIIAKARSPEDKDVEITNAAFRLIRLGGEQMARVLVERLFVPVKIDAFAEEAPQQPEVAAPAPKPPADSEATIRAFIARVLKTAGQDRATEVEQFVRAWFPGQDAARRRTVDLLNAWKAYERQLQEEDRLRKQAEAAAAQELANAEAAAAATQAAAELARQRQLLQIEQQRAAISELGSKAAVTASRTVAQARRHLDGLDGRLETVRVDWENRQKQGEATRLRAYVLGELQGLAEMIADTILQCSREHPRQIIGHGEVQRLRGEAEEELQGLAARRRGKAEHREVAASGRQRRKKEQRRSRGGDDPMAEWQADAAAQSADKVEEALQSKISQRAIEVGNEMASVDRPLVEAIADQMAGRFDQKQTAQIIAAIRRKVSDIFSGEGRVGVNAALTAIWESVGLLDQEDEATPEIVTDLVGQSLSASSGLEEKVAQFRAHNLRADLRFQPRARIVAPEITASGLGPLLAKSQGSGRTVLFVETEAQRRLLVDSLKMDERDVIVTGPNPTLAHIEEACRRLGDASDVDYMTERRKPNLPSLFGNRLLQLVLLPVGSQSILIELARLEDVRVADWPAAQNAVRAAQELLSDA